MNRATTLSYLVPGKWIVAALVGICGVLPALTGVADADQPDADTQDEVLYWTDPMVPGSRFDKPGRSPFMDMDLVPVYAGDANIVEVSAEQQRLMGLETETVSARPLPRTIDTVGDITYDERNVHNVTVRVNARVTRYFPIHKGQIVEKGQPLFELQGPEIYTHIDNYLSMKENAEKIRAVSTSQNRILQQSVTTLLWRGIPEETVLKAEKSGEPTDRFVVTAPVTGMVLDRSAVRGSLINAGIQTGQFTTYGTRIASIADISFVYAEAKLWGEQLDYVQPGMVAEIRPQNTKNEIYLAKVIYVYPVFRAGRRTGIARIAIDNPDYRLKPGMFAEIRIRSQAEQESPLVVPRNAVTYLESEQIVFVRTDETHFERRKVKVGMPTGDWVPVLRGLQEGERVVTSGAGFFLFAQLN